ncbi:MAG: DUF1460 domain-containing protein [Campylobacterota bacterium]|nr:DUF1460 domain-containing protein [Campylobacterota bacterium]
MKILSFLLLLSGFVLGEVINLGSWNEQTFTQFLQENKNNSSQLKARNFSERFLNTKYRGNVLESAKKAAIIKENLVINLAKLDCFTFIDYVEAMKRSNNYKQFKQNVIQIRYKNGNIDYHSRNHFFTDWISANKFEDITTKISPKAKKVTKQLNQYEHGKLYLEDIKVVQRQICYIDSKDLDTKILNKLQMGDYIGIYTPKAGLDVTHTGMIIKKDNQVYFRHASSKKKNRKVLDELFTQYIKKTPGFMVLRRN